MSFLGELVVRVRADTGTFTRDMNNAQSTVQRFAGVNNQLGNSMSQAGQKSEGFFSRISSGVGSLVTFGSKLGMSVIGLQGLTSGLTNVASSMFSYNAMMERYTKSFTQLLGGSDDAKKFLDDLYAFADKTPFDFEPLIQTAQALMGMGLEAKKVIPWMTAIGDAVSAAGRGSDSVNRVTLAITQMMAKGKVSAEEMNQLAEAGVQGWDIMAKATGKTKAELIKLASEGKLMAEDVLPKMMDEIEKMPGIAGQMKDASTNFDAYVAGLNDSWKKLLGTMMEPVFPMVKDALSSLYNLMAQPNVQEFARNIGTKLGDAVRGVAAAFQGVGTYVSMFWAGLTGDKSGIATTGELTDGMKALVDAGGKVRDLFKALKEVWEKISPAIQPATAAVKDLFDKFTAAVGQAIGGTADVIKRFADAAMNGEPWVKALGVAVGGLGGAFAAAKIALAVGNMAQGFSNFLPVLGQVMLSLSGFSGLLGPLGAVIGFLVSPVGLVVMAVGALVGGFIIAYNTIKPFHDWVNNNLVPLLQKLWEGIKRVAEWVGGQLKQAWDNIKPAFEAAGRALTQFGKDVQERVQPILDALKAWWDKNGPAITKTVQDMMTFLKQAFETGWKYISNIVGTAWKIIQDTVGIGWTVISGVIKIGLDILGGNWKKAWQDIQNLLGGVWKGIGKLVSDAWNGVKKTVTDLFDPIKDALIKPFNWAKDNIGGIVKGMVNFVIDRLNDGLRKIGQFIRFVGQGINKVGGLVGQGHIADGLANFNAPQVPRLARGTKDWAGGPALVGEEGAELVFLPAGASVVPAGPTSALLTLVRKGLPGFANGLGDWLGNIGNWISNTGSALLGKALDLAGIKLDLGGGLQNLGVGIANKLKDMAGSVLDGIKKSIGGGTGGTGGVAGNVMDWLRAALTITGKPQTWLSALYAIAMHESGGNPRAINLWDSNAKAGIPSKGLMQTIDPTFNAYKLAGLNDIWNPVHNAVAAIRYITARYGSVFGVPGIVNMMGGKGYVGYADGGWITEPVLGVGLNSGTTYGFGERGSEYVSPGGATQVIEIYLDGDLIGRHAGKYVAGRLAVKAR